MHKDEWIKYRQWSLYTYCRKFKKLLQLLRPKHHIKIELCVRLNVLWLFHAGHVIKNGRAVLSIDPYHAAITLDLKRGRTRINNAHAIFRMHNLFQVYILFMPVQPCFQSKMAAAWDGFMARKYKFHSIFNASSQMSMYHIYKPVCDNLLKLNLLLTSNLCYLAARTLSHAVTITIIIIIIIIIIPIFKHPLKI